MGDERRQVSFVHRPMASCVKHRVIDGGRRTADRNLRNLQHAANTSKVACAHSGPGSRMSTADRRVGASIAKVDLVRMHPLTATNPLAVWPEGKLYCKMTGRAAKRFPLAEISGEQRIAAVSRQTRVGP